MHMEKLIKKQVTLSIFSFVLISLIVIGTSTAFLRGIATTSTYESAIGKLSVEFTTGNTINLNTDPLDDTEAIATTDNIYNFTVKNTGDSTSKNVPYTYRVYLTSDSTIDLDARFIKYCIVEGDDGVDISSTNITASNCTPKSISDTSSFTKKEIANKENLTTTNGLNSKSYRLKIWLSNSFTTSGTASYIPNDVLGKTYELKINICGQSGTSLENLTSC